MDHSSPWDWTSSFRLHEAACLIAGLPCVSLKNPNSEDLPAGARPVLVKLATAYVCWYLTETGKKVPGTAIPLLEGERQSDGSLPPFQTFQLSGQLVSRKSLVNYLKATGRKSVYEFDLATKPESGSETVQEVPVPGVVRKVDAKRGCYGPGSSTKRDLLAPVIEAAQKMCGTRDDAPAIWVEMLTMATDSNRKLPLLGVDEDAIKWQDASDKARMFTIKNLRDRLKRARKSSE